MYNYLFNYCGQEVLTLLKKSFRVSVFIVLGLFIPIFAQTPSEEVLLHPVQNDPPFVNRSKAYQLGTAFALKMIKIRDNPLIATPPATTANVLYFGQIKLGSPSIDYGILFDLEGKQKQLWVDGNGTGDYSGQTPQTLFKNEKYSGVDVYYSPTPLTFNVKYTYPGHTYQLPIRFELSYLRVTQDDDDFFYLKIRTWLMGEIHGDNDDIAIALVDTNDNGNYNDPEDMLFIDWKYDLNFTAEGNPIKSSKFIKLPSKLKYQIDYSAAPEKLILKKG